MHGGARTRMQQTPARPARGSAPCSEGTSPTRARAAVRRIRRDCSDEASRPRRTTAGERPVPHLRLAKAGSSCVPPPAIRLPEIRRAEAIGCASTGCLRSDRRSQKTPAARGRWFSQFPASARSQDRCRERRTVALSPPPRDFGGCGAVHLAAGSRRRSEVLTVTAKPGNLARAKAPELLDGARGCVDASALTDRINRVSVRCTDLLARPSHAQASSYFG